MDLNQLNEEQSLFRDSIRKFVDSEIRPYVLDWESSELTPREIWKKCGELGYLGAAYPEKWGGLNADKTFSFIWASEIAKCGSLGVAMGLTVQSDMATPALARFGSDYLRDLYLKPAISGDVICSIAVSEPGCGSDVAAMQTRARRSGDEWVLNGRKMFITNGTQADFLTLLAKTDETKGHHGFSLFIVPCDTKGLDRGKKLKKTCFQSSDTAEIYLDDVRIPASHLIGEEGEGFIYQMQQFQDERLIGSALSIGAMEHCYELTRRYATEREVFGKQLDRWQVTRHKFAQMASELTMLKCMAGQCLDWFHPKRDYTREISMLKLMSAQIQQRVLDECVQIYGGYGLMSEYEVARYFRDSKLMAIGAGTNEVMKEIIAKTERS